MALTSNHRFDETVLHGVVTSVSSTSTLSLRAPFRGKIVKVGAMLSSAASTADATVTTSIAGTGITGGVITITQSGSAAGSNFTATPTAANICNEDDRVAFVFSGSGTAGGPVDCYAVIIPA